jgi:hypothetical protein
MPSCYALLGSATGFKQGLATRTLTRILEEELIRPAFDALVEGLAGLQDEEERQSVADVILADRAPNEAGRIFFSHLAFAGFHQTIGFYARAITRHASPGMVNKTLAGLRATDTYNRTPFHIAATSFGVGSTQHMPVHEALVSAAEELSGGMHWPGYKSFLAGIPVTCDISIDSTPPHLVRPTPFPQPLPPPPSLPVAADMQGKKQPIGGWPMSLGRNDLAELEAIPQDRCDLHVIQGPLTRGILARFDAERRPVLIRGGVTDGAREAFTRERMLAEYGGRKVKVGTFPYSESIIGTHHVDVKVSNFIDFAVRTAVSEEVVHVPYYAFLNNLLLPRQASATQTHAFIRSIGLLPLPVLEALDGLSGAGLQLSLGPPRAGAPVHYHVPAINSLVYGRKRWFLYPPDSTHQNTKEVIHWMSDMHATRSELLFEGGEVAFECVQQAGDMLFVPEPWGHAVLNLELSIGVAVEFSRVLEPHDQMLKAEL